LGREPGVGHCNPLSELLGLRHVIARSAPVSLDRRLDAPRLLDELAELCAIDRV
jgi:hypothetical protein